MLSSRQFAPEGDENARQALLEQLQPNFPQAALRWLEDPQVSVQPPSRIPAGDIDWDGYPDWRASHELKKVQKIARQIGKGKEKKPSVVASRPGTDDLLIIDGHHHALARVDRDEDPVAYIVHVPAQSGPWDTMHGRQQQGDKDKTDFGYESDRDRL